MVRCCGGRSPPKCIEVADFLTYFGHVRVQCTRTRNLAANAARLRPFNQRSPSIFYFLIQTANCKSVLLATGNTFGTQRLPVSQEQQPPLLGKPTRYNCKEIEMSN